MACAPSGCLSFHLKDGKNQTLLPIFLQSELQELFAKGSHDLAIAVLGELQQKAPERALEHPESLVEGNASQTCPGFPMVVVALPSSTPAIGINCIACANLSHNATPTGSRFASSCSPPLSIEARVNAASDRGRNPQTYVPALVELFRADDLEHTRLVLEKSTDDVSRETPQLAKFFRLEMPLKGIAGCRCRRRVGNREQL